MYSTDTTKQRVQLFSLSVTIGYMGRQAMGNDNRRANIYTTTPDDSYRSNTNGTGFSLGAEVKIVPWRIGLSYAPTLRYDHLYTLMDGRGSTKFVSSWLLEHNFAVLRYFKRKKLPRTEKQARKNNFYIGAGYSIINTGKQYSYPLDTFLIHMNLEYNTWSGFIGIPVWKLYIEPAFHYSRNFPFEFPRDQMIYVVRVYYKHKLL